MKHHFSRRLGSLVLAMAMALSLCVTPAMAADDEFSVTFRRTELTFTGTSEVQTLWFDKNNPPPDGATYTHELKCDPEGIVDVETTTQNDAYRIMSLSYGTTTLTATITATPIDGGDPVSATATCKITVAKPVANPVMLIMLSQKNLSLKVGGTAELKAEVRPTNATIKTVSWASDNLSVATVDADGKVTATGVGTAVITAAAMDGSGVTETCTVTVTGADPSLKLQINNLDTTQMFLEAGQSGTVNAVTTGSVDSITWTVSPAKNAPFTLVDHGSSATIIAGDKKGSGTVRVDAVFTTGVDSKGKPITKKLTQTLRVDIADSTSNRVTDIKLNRDEITLVQDETYQLTATLTPSNAASREVEWTSSNEAVAKVDSRTGKITAISGGEATITAKPRYGDVRAYCDVTVTPAATSIGPITGTGVSSKGDGTGTSVYTFTRSSRSDSTTVRAPLTPSTSDDSVLWKSENANIAVITGSGDQASLTRKGPGTAKITAVPVGPDGKVRKGVEPAVLEVTVSGLVLDHTTLTIQENRRDSLGWTAFGDAQTDSSTNCEWQSSDPSVVSVDYATGLLTARSKGEAVITATKSGYSASCTVKVVEDTTGVITLTGNHPAGTPVSMYNSRATSSAGSGTLVNVLHLVSQAKTRTTNADGTQTAGSRLRYITNLAVASTDQGILHDQHHSSADTGAGVGIQEIYYPTASSSQGRRSLNDLSFVPKTTFSGTAEISYTGMSENGQTFTGIIRLTVNGTGDVMYSSSEGSVVNFLSDDFNLYHPNFRSVSFTPPQESRGTLYYNYSNPSQPGTEVTAGDTYNRTGTPSVDKVAFVPAAGFNGTVTIPYTGTDTSGRSISGRVTITVTGNSGSSSAPGDIYYSMPRDSVRVFRPADFSSACRSVLGENLSHVRFTLPDSSDGTLFYNYRSFGDYDSAVASTTSYYYSGTPALSGVTFVPTTTTPSQVDISYTGYSTRGNAFTGVIHIGQSGSGGGTLQQNGVSYSGTTASSFQLSPTQISAASSATLGGTLSYITFTSLPSSTAGRLYLNYDGFGTGTQVTTGTRYYVSGTPAINQISFVPRGRFNGQAVAAYTAFSTTGENVNGTLTFNITNSGSSHYFEDLGYHAWAAPAVDYLCRNGVTNGVTPTTFGPEAHILRCDFVLMLCRAFGFGGVRGRSFADVPTNAYYAQAVAAAKKLGIVSGDGVNFMPNSELTRQDAMVMIKNALGAAGWNVPNAPATVLNSFPDGPYVASYAQSAVSTLVQMGAVSGDNGMLYPYNPISRAEAAVILHFVMTM